MVRHYAAYKLSAGAVASFRGKVNRLPEAVSAGKTESFKLAQVANCRPRRAGQGKKAAVWRDNKLLVHASLQRQRRAAVSLVAVAQRCVKTEIGAL